MAKEAQDTRRSSDTEQQCNVCRQVVAVGDRGEVGRRRHDGGRGVRAKEGATKAQQRWRDGGATVTRRRVQWRRDGGATVARWKPQRGRDDGRIYFLFACCSMAEQD